MKQNYTAVIVDDEMHQQNYMQKMLAENFPFIELVGQCTSVDQALKEIPILKPQLVFLDVELPPKTGFDLLKELPSIAFETIFTTSYSKYALQAFRVSALDYLLKPYSKEQLGVALDKFTSKKDETQSVQLIQNLLSNLGASDHANMKIALPTSTGLLFVRFADVIKCEAQNIYTVFYLADKNQVVVSRTMKECEELLGNYGFFRVHQSHLINMKYIKRYIKGDGGQVEMEDGSMVEVSRRRKEEFMLSLQKL